MYKSAEFIGNVTADPELKTLNGDSKLCTFSLAINTKIKEKEATEYFDFEAWNGKAEIIYQYVKKGDKLFLRCVPKMQQWEDNEGNKRRKVSFNVDVVEFLSVKKTGDE